MLFCLLEIRAMFKKHEDIVRDYYIRYISEGDSAKFSEVCKKYPALDAEYHQLITSLMNAMKDLSVAEEDQNSYDLNAFRLDWFRLQAYTSVAKPMVSIRSVPEFVTLMDAAVSHSYYVDGYEKYLDRISDMSFLLYAIAFPMACDHFVVCTNEFCPEERSPIRHRSVLSAERCLEDMAKQTAYHLEELCRELIKFEQQVLPVNAANMLKQVATKTKKKQKDKTRIKEFITPGTESFRKSRENITRVDRSVTSVTELLAAFTHFDSIRVANATLCPIEYLRNVIEDTFSGSFAALAFHDPDSGFIARPSELLRSISAFTGTLKTIDHFATADIGGLLFHSVLQHTQEIDSKGQKTVTGLYLSWLTDVLLNRIINGGICYSPSHKMFVSHRSVSLKAEDYTDVAELESLAEIIGPSGMRVICSKIVEKVCAEVTELKALSRRTPTLLTVIEEFLSHPPNDSYILHKYETASVTGIESPIDSVLYSALKPKKDSSNEDQQIWPLYMVMIAVSLPDFLNRDTFVYENVLGGFLNNAHCLAKAINQLASVFFSSGGDKACLDKLVEFISIASECVLSLECRKTENENEPAKQYEPLYILLDIIVQESHFLKRDTIERFISHTIIRDAYRQRNGDEARKRRKKVDARSHDY
ncbi:uncharacterized protein TRIADDRAFT_51857 [Trichoplax adhaerens]|uniref:Uncharacterized protein n=1 Tax=Trichoplax adhaerens TaxID=10228 RepID=B3RL29_TRIAD|nr:hypothetical protein TRIADDRAFT_51857 [Trichoplax adhaerens]EDV28689.1 hypothetical protein TRIADDRAFT_51857 [Trichoplax adhaerens]|eukprot:XP_002107891.1 hypothetical protein TRIADDRAFT_51857 [Trichoplax adhaerens]